MLRMGEILVQMGVLTPADVERILAHQHRSGQRFGQIAVAWGLARPRHIWEAWARQLAEGLRPVDLCQVGVDPLATQRFGEELTRAVGFVVVRRWANQMIVAIEHPSRADEIRRLPVFTRYRVYLCQCMPGQVDMVLAEVFRRPAYEQTEVSLLV